MYELRKEKTPWVKTQWASDHVPLIHRLLKLNMKEKIEKQKNPNDKVVALQENCSAQVGPRAGPKDNLV